MKNELRVRHFYLDSVQLMFNWLSLSFLGMPELLRTWQQENQKDMALFLFSING